MRYDPSDWPMRQPHLESTSSTISTSDRPSSSSPAKTFAMTGFPRSLRAATGASRAMLSTSCRASSSPTPGSSLPLSSRVSLVSTSRHGLESRCRCFMTSIQRAQSRKAPGIQPAKKSWAEFEEPVVLTEELARASDLESVIKANGYRHRPSQYIDCTEKFKSVADQYTRPWPFFLAEGEMG